MSTDLAYITPDIANWARERVGLSAADLGAKLRVSAEQIIAWETGHSHPPFDKAQSLAKALRIPFGYLFLSSRPKLDAVPLPDFRTLTGRYKPTPNFIDLLNEVVLKQDWYRDYIVSVSDHKIGVVGKFTPDDDARTVAADIRSTLSLNKRPHDLASNWSEYFRALARLTEDAGIMVMRSSVVGNDTKRKLSRSEFQGFAISDAYAPLVFVNTDDFIASQIFTLAHELAHIWIGKSAITNLDPSEIEAAYNTSESFCNLVAVETLVPSEDFERAWRPTADPEGMVEELARHFLVSSLVVLRRAYDAAEVPKDEFIALRDRQRAKIQAKRAAGGGDYYKNVMARMGRRLTDAVLADLSRGRTTYREAASLLSLKVDTLVKLSGKRW